MDDEVTLSAARDVAAPVERVWRAWLEPERIARWWGPAGFRSTVRELDVRPGGRLDIVMHGPDGTDYPNLYVFDAVEPLRRLRYTNTGSVRFGLAPFTSVVDLTPAGDRTRVALTSTFPTPEEKRRHVEDFAAAEGTRQLLERLESQAR